MKICFVTKYPPIQGGVSMRCYWLARGLAELGHDVAVVTNATEVEHAYRMLLDGDDAAWLEPTFDGGRVRLFTPDADSGELHHIPHSSAYASRLAGLATDVIKSHNSEVIFSYYLEPYGVGRGPPGIHLVGCALCGPSCWVRSRASDEERGPSYGLPRGLRPS